MVEEVAARTEASSGVSFSKVKCACGREIGCKVFRQHGRKCLAQLRAWKTHGADVRLLDERRIKNPLV